MRSRICLPWSKRSSGAGARDVFGQSLRAQGREAVGLLRGPADGERPAGITAFNAKCRESTWTTPTARWTRPTSSLSSGRSPEVIDVWFVRQPLVR
jgi:hypothetical protein